MAAKAAENPAAERRTVTVRIDDPPDVCSRAKVKKASDLNAARFCEALALQNPLSQRAKERSKVMGSRGEEIIVSDAPVYFPRAAIFGKTSSSILGPVKPRLHVAARRADFRCPRSQRAR